MTKLKMILCACLAMLMATPACATDFLFTLTGSGGTKISFVLSDQPTPDAHNVLGFTVDDVLISVGTLSGLRTLVFPTTGGLQIRNGGTLVLGLAGGSSPKLFTGSTANPTMKTGDFSLTGSSGDFALTVSAVPETSTWLMLILGFGAVGFGLRARVQRPRDLASLG